MKTDTVRIARGLLVMILALVALGSPLVTCLVFYVLSQYERLSELTGWIVVAVFGVLVVVAVCSAAIRRLLRS